MRKVKVIFNCMVEFECSFTTIEKKIWCYHCKVKPLEQPHKEVMK